MVSSRVHALVAGASPGRLAIAAAVAMGLAAGCGRVEAPGSSNTGDSDAMPGCTQACVSEKNLRECTMDGDRIVWCPAGCVTTAEPRCRSIVPSNDISTDHLMGVEKGLVIPEGAQAVLDTDSGEITVAGEPRRESGDGVRDGIGFYYREEDSVFAVSSFTMGRDSNLRAHGERPLVILSRGFVGIEGTIDVSAACASGSSRTSCGGPGGGDGADPESPATGCGPGENGRADDAQGAYGGGGGGGSGQAGAEGASAEDAPGGRGGAACASATSLRGGSGGGRAGFDDPGNDDGSGGGGGGAVQISSLYLMNIDPGAVINAGGGGGAASGGGGGGGGTILLEAPGVRIEGATLVANGGGGGGASPGEDGRLDAEQAQGGFGGGLGGARAGAPTTGLYAGSVGGGGGGGAGPIHVRAPMDAFLLEDSTVSPELVRLDPELD